MSSKLPPATPIPASPSRKDYTQDAAYQVQAERNAAPIFDRKDPFALFTEWMEEARLHELNDSNAMSLATLGEDGVPDVRMVLLKSFDADGFVFYTNFNSAKGRQLKAHPAAALCFHWKSLRRQVRIRGTANPVTDAEADAYFYSRARGSQIGAVASDQSASLESRALFEARLAKLEQDFDGKDIPRPAHWSGWRLAPHVIEFWRDRPFRLHDRLVFTRGETQAEWDKERLYP